MCSSDLIAATKTLLQEKYIEHNTAQISVDRADQQKKESANVYEDLLPKGTALMAQFAVDYLAGNA